MKILQNTLCNWILLLASLVNHVFFIAEINDQQNNTNYQVDFS